MTYKKKDGMFVSQRFPDASNREFDEDGTEIEKNVTEFVKDKVYDCHTVIINSSTSVLDLQVLQDIPQGSIPLSSYDYTKIESDVIGPYSIKSYSTKFYFPSSGTFGVYPSNASKSSKIIAKADQIQPIVVLDQRKEAKLESFTDILRSGTEKDIL